MIPQGTRRRGWGGDEACLALVEERLALVLATFPEHLDKARPPTWFEPEDIAKNDHFDAILRAHKRNRLAVPVKALLGAGARYHGFENMHLRRLAWFVPSLLAAWLDRPGHDDPALPTRDLERICASTAEVEGAWWAWTDDEAAALATFFDAVLSASLATPLPPAREPDAPRPLEDGIRVWSLHAPSTPLDTLFGARALRVPLEPLVIAWVNAEDALALDHLLEAVFDPTVPAKKVLAEESVAERLADAFFETEGERALRLSKAEKHVRRWISRREQDFEDLG